MDFFGAIWHHTSVSDDPKFPSDLADRFQLRMPSGMRDRMAEAAKANGRSMNSEMVARLEASFAEPDLDPDAARRAAEVAERIVSRVIERIERDPLPQRVKADRPIEEDLADSEHEILNKVRQAFGEENVELIVEPRVVMRVYDKTLQATHIVPFSYYEKSSSISLDGDLYIVRRALGRDDVEIPVEDGRVQLDKMKLEPMTRMMLATLLGYVDLYGQPVEPTKAGETKSARMKLGTVKRKLLL